MAPLFGGTRDRYGGVTVSSSEEPCSEEELEERLGLSLAGWQEERVRVAWFHVAPAEAAWIPVLVKQVQCHVTYRVVQCNEQGFSFHHANPERVALLRWLAEEEVRSWCTH